MISQEIIIFRKLDFADQRTDIILYEMHETDPGFQFYQNRYRSSLFVELVDIYYG